MQESIRADLGVSLEPGWLRLHPPGQHVLIEEVLGCQAAASLLHLLMKVPLEYHAGASRQHLFWQAPVGRQAAALA